MRERRRFLRIPENSPVSYEVLHDKRTEKFLTKDIGQGGIRFFIYKFVPKNSLLKIRVNLQKISFYFETVVRVVWIKEEVRNDRYEIGVEFIDLPKEVTKPLTDYIERTLRSIL